MENSSLNQSTEQQQLMQQVLNDPKYKGKHVIIMAGQIFMANTGDGASQILARLRKDYPGVTPAVTYIPDADTLILWL
jgi:hypothetical protein